MKTFHYLPAVLALTGTFPLLATEFNPELGGSLRANYNFKQYNAEHRDTLGELSFNMLELKISDRFADDTWGINASYRFMNGYDYLRYGYIYYNLSPDWQLQAGIVDKPFGNINNASNSWWYSINYYVGFESDPDAGMTALYHKDQHRLELGLFKNAEYQNGRGLTADIISGEIGSQTYHNQETNQLNLRYSYFMEQGEWSAILGSSLELGQIYNTEYRENGDRYAIAAHADLSYQDWNLQLQALHYDYRQFDEGGAFDASRIGMGMVNSAFEITNRAQVYSANIARSFDTRIGRLKLYNDYSHLVADSGNPAHQDTRLNVTGASLSYEKFFLYLDHIYGHNLVWTNGDGDNHLGLPQSGSGWGRQINLNIGYYF
ncbi:hypothetical protein [Ferrimonas pelagia]|uniref:Outer membrane beta barrel protein n=1 Tax=Ferrimonas pelagia TaxID=1177826 RepID=A0ABP9EQH3_9GAMM